jgi:chromosome segregation ATPase
MHDAAEKVQALNDRLADSEAENTALKEENERLKSALSRACNFQLIAENESVALMKDIDRLKNGESLALADLHNARQRAGQLEHELLALKARVADYEEALADKRRLVRELDFLLNGDAAAKQASLCDIISQLSKHKTPILARVAELEVAAIKTRSVAMANARNILRPKTTSNWGLYMHLFGCGSTSAIKGCQQIGLDPDDRNSSLLGRKDPSNEG